MADLSSQAESGLLRLLAPLKFDLLVLKPINWQKNPRFPNVAGVGNPIL
jgi:hypothetical protein